ncbi:MAG: EB domain-containing protein [Archangium sp.]
MRALVALMMVLGGSAAAQCNTDSECPAGGACTNGTCVTPGTPAAPVAAPAAPEALAPSVGDQASKSKGNWAAGGASIGFIGTGPVVVSGIFAMFFLIFGPNSSTIVPGVIFTALTGLFVAGLGPLAELGAASARYDESNEGSPGSRVMGWVLYGVSLAGTVATLTTWFFDPSIAFLLELGTLITGATALLLFALDAVDSGVNAIVIEKRRNRTTQALRVIPTFSLAPRRSAGGGFDPVLGLAGTF